MAKSKEPRKGYLTPATDTKHYQTPKARMMRLVELQLRLFAQIDAISKHGEGKDKAIDYQAVFDAALKTKDSDFAEIYRKALASAITKFTGVEPDGDDMVTSNIFDQYDEKS